MAVFGDNQTPGITISPVGGLGNQLFIYAAGYSASIRQGVPLFIDDSWFANQSERFYELDTFASAGIKVSEKIQKLFAHRSRQARLARLVASRLNVPPFKTIPEKKLFSFNPDALAAPPGVRLTGFLQSYKYFEDVAHQIREQLLSIIDPSPWFLETQSTLASLGPWVSVHVRRGDFLNKGTREVHGIVSGSYYSGALKIMERLIPEVIPVVFSDDPKAASKMLRDEYPRSIFIDSPATSANIESVVLMSQSAGSIIANSSFSWWGAWLGDKPIRPVIAPRPWMDDPGFHELELFPPGWLTLGRDLEKTINS